MLETTKKVEVLNERCMRKKKITPVFTGERMIPDLNKEHAFYFEHINRYLFSQQFVKGKSVLDAGCGSGYGANLLKKAGAKKVVGVDIDEESVGYATQEFGAKGISFKVKDLNTSFGYKTKFDVVTCYEVIEHVPDADHLLTEIKKCLKQDGTLCVSTPNIHMQVDDNPFHIREYEPEEFEVLLKKYFKHVHLLDQSFYFANTISPMSKLKSVQNIVENEYIEEQVRTFTPPSDKEKTRYIIAVCSNKRINLTMNSVASFEVDGYSLREGAEGMHARIAAHYGGMEDQLNEMKDSKVFILFKIYSKLKRLLVRK